MIANPVKRSANAYVARTDWVPLLLESLAAVVLGILLLVQPQNASQLVVALIGLFCLIRGMTAIVSLFRDRKGWGWRLAGGILGIVAGALLIVRPLGTAAYLGSAVIVWLIAAAGAAYGVVMMIRGFAYAGWGSVVLGLLSLVLSFLLVLGAPKASLAVPWLVGLLAIAAGGAGIVAAFRKRAGKQ